MHARIQMPGKQECRWAFVRHSGGARAREPPMADAPKESCHIGPLQSAALKLIYKVRCWLHSAAAAPATHSAGHSLAPGWPETRLIPRLLPLTEQGIRDAGSP